MLHERRLNGASKIFRGKRKVKEDVIGSGCNWELREDGWRE